MAKDFEQHDLLKLSDRYFRVADILAGERVDRMTIPIGEVRKEEDGQVHVVPPGGQLKQLSGIELLIALRDLRDYRGLDLEGSRYNTQVVAKLGGLASRQLFNRTVKRNIQLSRDALDRIQAAFVIVQSGLKRTFTPAVRPLPRDRKAYEYLLEAGRTLGDE